VLSDVERIDNGRPVERGIPCTSNPRHSGAAARLPSSFHRRNRGDRGLTALERLMGVPLMIAAIQMLHPGIPVFFA
jgi:hypothetical protein